MNCSGKKLFSLFILTLFGIFGYFNSSLAYTGTYGILPPPVGGPGSVTVTNFDIDTKANNPQTIPINLYFVQSIVIETNPEIKSNLLIKEYPEGSAQAFDIIVPQPAQDALVQAVVYVWAPDAETLVVQHEHQGEPTIYENANKVLPEISDGSGNVLWSFTVTSFSSFSLLESITDSVQKNYPWQGANGAMLAVILASTLMAPLALRRN